MQHIVVHPPPTAEKEVARLPFLLYGSRSPKNPGRFDLSVHQIPCFHGQDTQNATSVHKKGGFYGQKYEMVASIQKKGCYLGRDVNSIVFGTVSRQMSADVSKYAGTLTHSILDTGFSWTLIPSFSFRAASVPCPTLPGLATLGTPFQFRFNMSTQMWVPRAEMREKCSRYHRWSPSTRNDRVTNHLCPHYLKIQARKTTDSLISSFFRVAAWGDWSDLPRISPEFLQKRG